MSLKLVPSRTKYFRNGRASMVLPVAILKLLCISVVVTVLANTVVLLVLWMKRKRSKTTHGFIAALAISDICMSVTIHPMIIATSFGADTDKLFTQKGTKMNTIRVLLWNRMS